MKSELPLVLLLALSSSALGQEPREYACSSIYSAQLVAPSETEELISLGRDTEIETYKLIVVETNEVASLITFEELSDSKSTSYFCMKRSSYPNLREPPVTYSCTSDTTQFFFNSTNHIFMQIDLFSASLGPVFPFLKGKCSESKAEKP